MAVDLGLAINRTKQNRNFAKLFEEQKHDLLLIELSRIEIP